MTARRSAWLLGALIATVGCRHDAPAVQLGDTTVATANARTGDAATASADTTLMVDEVTQTAIMRRADGSYVARSVHSAPTETGRLATWSGPDLAPGEHIARASGHCTRVSATACLHDADCNPATPVPCPVIDERVLPTGRVYFDSDGGVQVWRSVAGVCTLAVGAEIARVIPCPPELGTGRLAGVLVMRRAATCFVMRPTYEQGTVLPPHEEAVPCPALPTGPSAPGP